MLHTLNSACGDNSISDERLNKTFDVWYPTLEDELKKIIDEKEESGTGENSMGQDIHSSEILEEILDLSRENQKLIRNPDNRIYEKLEALNSKIEESMSINERNIEIENNNMYDRYNRFFLNDFVHEILTECDSEYSFLILLSFYKDDFPWLYNMGKELINILGSKKNINEKHMCINNFRRMLEFTCEHPAMREL